MGSTRRRRWLWAGVVSLLCVAVVSKYAMDMRRRTQIPRRFREHVVDPVPESVADLKMDQPMTHGGYGYVFRFSISEADLELIRASHPFRRARELCYGDGVLSWDWADTDWRTASGREAGHVFTIYTLVRQPSWFDLESWSDPDAYALATEDSVTKDGDVQVLIHDRVRERACFVAFHYDGRGL